MTKNTYKRRLKRLVEFEEFLAKECRLTPRYRPWQIEEDVRRLWYIMDDEPVELPEVGKFNKWSLSLNFPEGNEEFTVHSSVYNYQSRVTERTPVIPLINLIRFIKRKAKEDLLSCA